MTHLSIKDPLNGNKPILNYVIYTYVIELKEDFINLKMMELKPMLKLVHFNYHLSMVIWKENLEI